MANFEYTAEMYNEDMRLILWTYKNKGFVKHKTHKDDMFQCALIKLLKARENYTEDKGKYSSYAIKTIEGAFLEYLDRCVYDIAKRKRQGIDFTNDSLNATLPSGENELIDLMGEEDQNIKKIEQDNYFEALKQAVTKIITKDRRKKYYEDGHGQARIATPKKNIFKQREMVLDYYLNTNSFAETAKKFNVTRQCVEQTIKKYKPLLQKELVEMGLVDI